MNEVRPTAGSDPDRGTDIDFLAGGGELGALIRAYDWCSTPLGPIETWPQSLKIATAILLRSPVPIVMLWGEDGIMIYNDAYSVFAASRHPRLLGSKVLEGWPEVADLNTNVMKVGLAGGTLAYRDEELTLYRTGAAEQVWVNVDYSPVLDESGKPAGVIAIVVETTERVLAERRNAVERERLTQMFEQAPGFMAMLRGADHVFELANPAYMQLIGHRDVIGKAVREALPEIKGQGFFELLDDVYRTGEAFVGTAMKLMLQQTPDGPAEERFVDFVYQPITDADGKISGIFIEGSDVTERKRDEQLAQRLAAIVESSDDAIASKDLEGTITSWNRGAEQLFGYTADEAIGKPIMMLVPPDQPDEQPEILQRIQCGERIDHYETVRRRKDGSLVEISLTVSPITDGGGRVIGASKIARDITEHKRAEQHRDLLLAELNHRVKNTLVTVQSIVAQALRSAPVAEGVREAIESRLIALSMSHDLLTRENWETAGLRDLVKQAVEPFETTRNSGTDRFAILGDEIRLQPNRTLALGMAFHELATNAAKYGALSNDTGQVRIAWMVEGDRLRLRWEEHGGPPVKPPARRGFGSRLIERGLPQELDGSVRLDYAPDGVVCEVDMPLHLRGEDG